MPSKFKFNVEFPVQNKEVVVCKVTVDRVDPRFEHLKTIRDESVIDTGLTGKLARHLSFESYPDNSPFGNSDRKFEPCPEFFKGVCVRKAGDEIDIATAKEIAKYKALRQAYKWFKARENEYIADMVDYVTRAMQHVNMIQNKIEDCEDEIQWRTQTELYKQD